MSDAFDLVVIGGGNAGQAAARTARAAGWSVALVERDLVGGTCPNRGCVPKKVLVAAASVVDHVRRAQGHGVVGEARLDWTALQAARHAIVDPLPGAMAKDLADQGVTLVRGSARFTGPGALAVGDRALAARAVVIATGSAPRALAMPGAARAVTSAEVLALPRVPRTAVFIGAGVVAFELSHVLARAGCERIVLLEPGARPLPRSDADAIAALVAYSASTLGITVETGAQVTALEAAAGDETVVRYTTNTGAAARMTAALVVNGAGRVPQLADLDLARAGITVAHDRVTLAPDLRCVENPDVVIVGDANADLPQLSPLATSLGTLVAENLVHDRHIAPDLRTVASCVFTIPTLAQVGLTEEQAAAQGVAITAKLTSGMAGWISSRTHHEELAFAKVLIAPATGLVVGAHLIGHGAEGNIHLLALAMRHGIRAADLATLDAAYPTDAADLRYLL